MTSEAYQRPPVNPWIIALTVTLATFMEVLDTSVANVALPHIPGSLSAGQDESTWILTSYLFERDRSAYERLVFTYDRPQTLLYVLRSDLYDQLVSMPTGAQSRYADFFSRVTRAVVEDYNQANKQSWLTHLRRRNAGWPSRSMAWLLCSHRPLAPLSVDGSLTISIGAGFSSSIFQWELFLFCSRTA